MFPFDPISKLLDYSHEALELRDIKYWQQVSIPM